MPRGNFFEMLWIFLPTYAILFLEKNNASRIGGRRTEVFIMKQRFGLLPDGREVFQYTLQDGAMSCDVLTWGAAVRALRVPDKDGTPLDVLLGFDTIEAYLKQTCYLGAVVGRFANRIGDAAFELDGVRYPLAANDGKNHLHGGLIGFDRQIWNVEAVSDNAITLSLTSPDGQEGYPGTLIARVTYTLEGGALRIDYRAETDKPTVCNLTNHSYFNLDGHDSGDILRQSIQIHADCFTPTDAGSIPTGELAPVDGTPMDLRDLTPIGKDIDADFAQLQMAGGYDHNYVLRGSGLREAAVAKAARSGITMRVETTQPGIQFYSGNYLDGCPDGKGGAPYKKRYGFCLETQVFPDAPNKPDFPTARLNPGEVYEQTTVYRFSAEG